MFNDDYVVFNRHNEQYVVSAKYNSYYNDEIIKHDQIEPPNSHEEFEIEYTSDPTEAITFYSLEKAKEYVLWLKERTSESWGVVSKEKAEYEYLKEGIVD